MWVGYQVKCLEKDYKASSLDQTSKNVILDLYKQDTHMNPESFDQLLNHLVDVQQTEREANEASPGFQSPQSAQIKALKGLLFHTEFGTVEALRAWIADHQDTWKAIWGEVRLERQKEVQRRRQLPGVLSSWMDEEEDETLGSEGLSRDEDRSRKIIVDELEEEAAFDFDVRDTQLSKFLLGWLCQLQIRGDQFLVEGVRAWMQAGMDIPEYTWVSLMEESWKELKHHPDYQPANVFKGHEQWIPYWERLENHPGLLWNKSETVHWAQVRGAELKDKNLLHVKISPKRTLHDLQSMVHFQVLKQLWTHRKELNVAMFEGDEAFFEMWVSFMERPKQLHALAKPGMTDAQKEAWVQCWLLKAKYNPVDSLILNQASGGLTLDDPALEPGHSWVQSQEDLTALNPQSVNLWQQLKSWVFHDWGFKEDLQAMEAVGVWNTKKPMKTLGSYLTFWSHPGYHLDVALRRVYRLFELLPDWDLVEGKIDRSMTDQLERIHRSMLEHFYREWFYPHHYIEGSSWEVLGWKQAWLDVVEEKAKEPGFRPIALRTVAFNEVMERLRGDLGGGLNKTISKDACVRIEQQYPLWIARLYDQLGKGLVFEEGGSGFRAVYSGMLSTYWSGVSDDLLPVTAPVRLQHWIDSLTDEDKQKEPRWIQPIERSLEEFKRHQEFTPEGRAKWLSATLDAQALSQPQKIKRRL